MSDLNWPFLCKVPKDSCFKYSPTLAFGKTPILSSRSQTQLHEGLDFWDRNVQTQQVIWSFFERDCCLKGMCKLTPKMYCHRKNWTENSNGLK